MKNKYLLLSLAILTTFSLGSCTKREKKIDVEAGNEIINNANKATNLYYADFKTKDFFSASINETTKGKYNYSISYPNDISKNKINQKFEFDVTFDYKGNHDVKEIKSNPANLSNTTSYLTTSYTIDNNDLVNKTNLKISQTGTNLSIYKQYLEEAPENKNYTLNAEEVSFYSNSFVYLLNEFSEVKIIKYLLPGIDDVDYQRIKLQYQKFNAGEIDAQEFIDYIDFYVFSRNLFDNTPEGTYECCIKLLENKDEILPSNFFDFTKISDKTSTTLNAIFDYKEWGLSVSDTLSKIIKELKEEDSSFEMVSSIQNSLLKNLPDHFELNYSLTLNENNIITGTSINFIANGSIDNISAGISNTYPVLKDAKVEYDIELVLKVNCLVSEEKIEFESL